MLIIFLCQTVVATITGDETRLVVTDLLCMPGYLMKLANQAQSTTCIQ